MGLAILVNGEATIVGEGASVGDLLTQLDLGPRWVVVERNGEPVPRDRMASTTLSEGDRIELVRAVAGGSVAVKPDISRCSLYLCTPDRPDLEVFVASAIRGGVDIVQLRDKNLEARALVDRARRALRVCRGLGVPFILNDRPDLALEVGADGVHVGQDDAPPSLARRILGPDAIIGFSTHSPEDLAAAGAEPVDYVSVGPIVATPTKPGRPGTGLGYVTHAAAHSALPFFVTGGASPDTVGDIVAAGARGVVVVRYLTEASDAETAARALRRALDAALQVAVKQGLGDRASP